MSFTIKIKKNKKMDLNIPEFTCDHNPIGEHLNKYDMLSNLNAYNFSCFIGRPGSGKTSLLISFLEGRKKNKVFRKCFNNVLLVMPSSSIQSMKNNIFKKHDEDKMYDELTVSTINDIYSKLNVYSGDKENTLLIMDDVGASLKDKAIQKTLKTIIYNRRHLKVSIIMLCQSYLSIVKEIRKLITNIFMFKPSKTEMVNFMEELFECKKDAALDLLSLYQDKHDYLMLNVESQRIFHMFDEVLIEEN